MAVYTRSSALARLGLDDSATVADINLRFRELARQAHPDTRSDEADEVDFADLLAARDAALSIGNGVALELIRPLPPAQLARELEALRSEIAELRTTDNSRAQFDAQQTPISDAVAGIAAGFASRYREAQRRATGAATLAAASSAASGLTIPGPAAGRAIAATALGLLAVFQGARVWALRMTSRDIRHALDDASGALSDVPTYVAVLDEMTSSAREKWGQLERMNHLEWLEPEVRQALPPWTRNELEATIDSWIQDETGITSPPLHVATLRALKELTTVRVPHQRQRTRLVVLARTVGAHDFGRLLIDAGLSLRVLDELRSFEGVPTVTYEPTFDLLQLPPRSSDERWLEDH